MIIGNGLIAKSFKKEKNYFKNVIIFASGVSNSIVTFSLSMMMPSVWPTSKITSYNKMATKT